MNLPQPLFTDTFSELIAPLFRRITLQPSPLVLSLKESETPPAIKEKPKGLKKAYETAHSAHTTS